MNKICISGDIVSNPAFSHEFKGEKFYVFFVSSTRISGKKDIIRCLISELMVENISEGKMVEIFGEIRTYSYENHLIIYVFVESVNTNNCYENSATIHGFICKNPLVRKTSLGKDICDFFVAVNRMGGKSSYIPCISWGRNAFRTAKLSVGTEVEVVGRLQSREYLKKYENGEKEVKTAYELSVNELYVYE